MELNEKRTLEILLGLILITLLITMTFLLLPQKNSNPTTRTTITNSFNTINYYNTQDYHYTRTYHKNYDYLDYTHKAYKKKTKSLIGTDVEHYKVLVKNKEYKGGYFRVTYYFTDYYGKTKTETITHYIKPKQTKEFIYTNIHKDKYKYYDWDYQVISRTKV